jgi:hypothetical protein
MLFWNQRKYKHSVYLGKANNVATFSLSEGFEKFTAFCAETEVDYAEEQVDPIICLPAQMVSNDEQSDNKSKTKGESTEDEKRSSNEGDADDWIMTIGLTR